MFTEDGVYDGPLVPDGHPFHGRVVGRDAIGTGIGVYHRRLQRPLELTGWGGLRCPEHGVRQVAVSWARPGSGFTLLFEALLITFASSMPVARVAAFTGEDNTRIWRVLKHYVTTERAKLDFSTVERVGVDETAAARGQDYISVFMDADAHRVLFATPGRDGDTVKAFAADLTAHGGYPEAVGNVTVT